MRALVATPLLFCRVAVIALCSASLACVVAATDAGDYTVFRFLEVVLYLQLPWSLTRLAYDAVVTLFDAPLPGRRASWAIVVAECALSCLTYAAGACTLAVQVHFERDARACDFLAPGACRGYKASALLALLASVFTSAIAALLFYLRASRHAHALG
ncbi:unnamed protein product [Urochloa decumbens]|uniref:CASP-like protein n=1 Tax=Urochloa decumbens TaxID=240449 RepID=A0ABC9F6A0_9POAL